MSFCSPLAVCLISHRSYCPCLDVVLSVVTVWLFLNSWIQPYRIFLDPRLSNIKQFWTEGVVVPLNQWENRNSEFLPSASLNKGSRNSLLLGFLGLAEGEVRQRWPGLQSHPVFLILSTRRGMVYRFLPHFKDYLLMFSDTYPISRNSRELISTVNYILSIFWTEQAILMQSSHQSGHGKWKALIGYCVWNHLCWLKNFKLLRI